MGIEGGRIERRTGHRGDDSGDPLAPAGVVDADDEDVVHVRVADHDALDLFREDLLAAGVDAHRPPAEELDRAVLEHGGGVAGDFARWEADGTVTLLGRGSVCINTGGEKVFPEEVEEVLKTHPAVLDAVCVGVPDEKFGEAITAMVEPAAGQSPAEAELISWVKERLAHYKAPKRVLQVDTVGRSPSGKVDYKGLKQLALQRLGIDAR